MDHDPKDPKDPLREEPEELQDPTAGQDGDSPFPGMPAASGPITKTDVDGKQDDAEP